MGNGMIEDIKQPEIRRGGDIEILKVFEKFDSITRIPLGHVYERCGNIQMSYPATDIYDHVSAPMGLARLVSAGFQVQVFGRAGYKTTWEVLLRHKASDKVLYFHDYKGGMATGSSWPLNTKTDAEFIKDAEAVCQALINPRFPHPYDGCVVGEIA